MFFNSRTSALLLSFIIATVTSMALYIFVTVPVFVLAIVFFVCFSVSFLMIFASLEFLIFRELNKIQRVIESLNKKELKHSLRKIKNTSNFNPLKKITSEIFSFASRKQEEVEELKKLETYRREFLADISHELKTPLFAAQGFVHTLLDGAMDDENVREKFLKKAAKSLDGLNMLVQDLLLLSQIETGEMKMQITSFDIQKLSFEVVEQLEHKAEKREVKLKLKAPDSYIVKGDRMRIYQVIVNLADNAIKYGGNFVEIELEKDRDNILVSVHDNGPGIHPEHLKRIFDRFYRIEKSRNKDKGGTGLGLSIVKNVLDAHDSKIQVFSKIGKGTTFAFKLPVGNISELTHND